MKLTDRHRHQNKINRIFDILTIGLFLYTLTTFAQDTALNFTIEQLMEYVTGNPPTKKSVEFSC